MGLYDKIVHITILAVYLTVTCYCWPKSEEWESALTNPDEESFFSANSHKNHFLFAYAVPALCYMAMIYSDIMGQERQFAEAIFAAVAVPVGLITSTTFWAMYAIEKEALIPSWLDKNAPYWINHALFTFNSVPMIVDMMITRHEFPSHIDAIKYILLSMGLYNFSIIDKRLKLGKYIYKMLNDFTDVEVGYYCLLNVVLAFIFYVAARSIYKLRWGASSMNLQEKKKKKNKRKNETVQNKQTTSNKKSTKSKNTSANPKKK